MLHFSDGVIVNTNGPYRVIQIPDGWYVTGQGYLIPVDSDYEGWELIFRMANPAPLNDEPIELCDY